MTLRAGWTAAAGVVLIVASGCTICPDPFDYTGPVPDGSAPQNDFRARAGGIAPLDGVRRPWPPVVQAGPDAGDESRSVIVADIPGPEAAPDDGEAATPVQPVASVQSAAEAEADAGDTTDESGGGPTVTPEPALEEILPPAQLPRPEITPPLRETPGWRPRN